MVSGYNQELIRKTLSLLGVNMSELFRRARESEQPGNNSHETERKARKDYERFKDGIYPQYLIQFCELVTLKSDLGIPHSNVRNLSARRFGASDLNARRKPGR